MVCARSWDDICAAERTLIEQFGSVAPRGYNLRAGGEGVYGYKPTPDAIECSAAKHRGKPCHPNTRRVSSEFHKGRKRSPEHRAKIAAAKRGTVRSVETRAKIRSLLGSAACGR